MSSVSENEITSGETLLPLSEPELETVSGGDPSPESQILENDVNPEISTDISSLSGEDVEALIAAINDGSVQIVHSQEHAYTVAIILIALLVGIEWIKGLFISWRE